MLVLKRLDLSSIYSFAAIQRALSFGPGKANRIHCGCHYTHGNSLSWLHVSHVSTHEKKIQCRDISRLIGWRVCGILLPILAFRSRRTWKLKWAPPPLLWNNCICALIVINLWREKEKTKIWWFVEHFTSQTNPVYDMKGNALIMYILMTHSSPLLKTVC